MHDLPILHDLVILVAVAIPVVILAHRLKIPSIVGFLLTGLAIGPYGLRFIGKADAVHELAEVGVVLLLFAIGLELELSRILRMGKEVVRGGSLQLLGTIAAVAALMMVAGRPVNVSLFVGALVAFSSTAIILKVYAQRNELDTSHGRVVVAVAIFQDLAVVPVMLLVPILAGHAAGPLAALKQIGVALLPVVLFIVLGRTLVPKLLEHVVRLQNREIFTLCVVFLGLGSAYLASLFGISLALGAFLAGLLISESEYGLQALSDVLPFRDTFSGIFFISIGMLLDVRAVIAQPLPMLLIVSAVLAVKAAVASGAVLALRQTLVTALTAGFGLAQIGEFSFVLASAGVTEGLLSDSQYQTFLAVSVMSMLVAPFLISAAQPFAELMARATGYVPLRMGTAEHETVAQLEDHVIIVGYGLNGRNLARALRTALIKYVILESHGGVVREAREAGEPIFFGDGVSTEVLERVGIHRARVIVYCIAAPDVERRGVAVSRSLNPRIHIVVRTRYVSAIEDLRKLGADEVVPEEFETSLEIFSRVLRRYGVPRSAIRAEVEAVRHDHYDVLRDRARPFGHLTDLAIATGVRIDVEPVETETGSPAVGQNPITMRLRKQTGASVVAVIRSREVIYEAARDFAFAPGDTVVLVGVPDALGKATALFRAPAPDGASAPPSAVRQSRA